MGFARARVRLVGAQDTCELTALVDTGAWYTVLDRELAERIGVRPTGLTVVLTASSGHRVRCEEAILESLVVEGRSAPSELVAVCSIPEAVRALLRRQGVSDEVVVGVHTLERLGLAVDPVMHRLVESPGVLMI